MSVANTAVKALYQGNGSNDTFAIPFAYIAVEASTVVKVYKVDVDGVKTLQTEGALQDYILDPPYNATTNPAGPANVIFNTAPAADVKVLVTRTMLLRQVVAFSNIGRIPGESVEQGLDRLCYLIQQLNDKLGRTLEFNILDDGVVAFDVPKIAPDTYLGFNDTGTAIVLKTAAEIFASIPGGGGVPPGGDAFALLEKKSATEGDADWSDPFVYDGYSERYSQIVNLQGLKATTDFIMDMGYAPPTASLSSDVSNSLRERGDLVTAMTLSATIGVVLDDIAEVRFYYDGGLIDTQSSGGAIPTGGVSTFAWTGSFGTNKTFSVQVDDVSAQAKPSATSNRSYSFVYPYYYGVGAPSLSAASVAGLTKQIITDQSSANRSFTPSVGNVYYFAYPASYGSLTSILDQNGFETIADWTLRTENITGLDASAVSYKIYEFNNPVGVAGTYSYTFIG